MIMFRVRYLGRQALAAAKLFCRPVSSLTEREHIVSSLTVIRPDVDLGAMACVERRGLVLAVGERFHGIRVSLNAAFGILTPLVGWKQRWQDRTENRKCQADDILQAWTSTKCWRSCAPSDKESKKRSWYSSGCRRDRVNVGGARQHGCRRSKHRRMDPSAGADRRVARINRKTKRRRRARRGRVITAGSAQVLGRRIREIFILVDGVLPHANGRQAVLHSRVVVRAT